MAAGLAASAVGVKSDIIRESLADFYAMEHRLEFVAMINNVEFINDSKAISIDAVWYALETIYKPIIWIAGGLDTGTDYNIILNLVREKVKTIICLTKDNRNIQKAFSKETDCFIINAESAATAVQSALHFSAPGDVVLLSPGCASFDLFENFEERGKAFKESVLNL